MSKVITMSEEYASKLITDLLDAFGIAISFWHTIHITESILDPEKGTIYRRYELNSKLSIEDIQKESAEKGKKFIRTSKDIENPIAIITTYVGIVSNEDFIETDVLTATFRNRKFEVIIYDTPDCLGYNSVISDFDYETYLCAIISELRGDGSKKYSMTFGFDIEKMQFLELFDLQYINQCGVIREPENVYELEKKFHAKDVLQILIEQI